VRGRRHWRRDCRRIDPGEGTKNGFIGFGRNRPEWRRFSPALTLQADRLLLLVERHRLFHPAPRLQDDGLIPGADLQAATSSKKKLNTVPRMVYSAEQPADRDSRARHNLLAI
jgi:hypothetical protein